MKKYTRVEQKEQTRSLLIKTAYDVFSKKGIMNARISDIAEKAEVAHGTVFIHFSSLDALIEEVVVEYGQKIARNTHENAQSCNSLKKLLRGHLDGIMEYESFYVRLVLESRMIPIGARDAFIGIQSAISLHFSQVAQREIRSSQKEKIPTYMLFNLWIGLVHHYLANSDLFAPKGNVIRRYGDSMIECFMELLSQKEGKA